jgi:prepilin-type N-terminal cleavage/methylation domain-containing protein
MRERQRGFTLIELMVSLVIFSFAIAGVLSVAVSMAQGFREQRQAVAAEDNVRAAMDFISDAIRSMSPLVTQGGTIYDNDSCKQWQQAGLAGTCVNDGTNCKDSVNRSGNQTAAPDALRLVFASGGVVTSITDPGGYLSCAPAVTLVDASGVAAGDLLLIGDIASNSGEIASVASVAGNVVTLNTCLCPFGKTYAQKSLVVRVQRAKFYVDTYDSVPNILLMDTSPLAFSDAAGGTATPEPLAENVEDFQVAYGLDTTNGGAGQIPPGPVTAWEYSNGVGNTAGALRAIRITIITTTSQPLQASATNNPFIRPAAEDHPVSGTADKYRRRILTSTVEVRNFGGSP